MKTMVDNEATIEELFMLLYFLKSQLGNLEDEEAQELIKKDYRVNLLVQMIFDKYEPAEVEFSYQVTTVLSLSIMSKFYNLELSSDQKDKLIEGLLLLDGEQQASTDGSFLPEIPSLVFCLHLLMTETNKPKVLEASSNLSMLYLMVIGERIDALSVSNLLCGWREVDLIVPGDEESQAFEMLKRLVLEKQD